MISVKSQNAMAEVLWYLKGIKEDDINKIPKDIINFIKQNASKEYNCTFNYNKPLKELNLLDESRGIIAMLCYKYWCTTKEQKEMYLKKLNNNEANYQMKMNEKYNSNNLFKNNNQKSANTQNNENNTKMIEYKESIFKRLFAKMKNMCKAFTKK
ncbi:MAG: hypothetical protein IKD76_02975 [Clostridia bacterium]|nr:hypothetical protein [Clostridia bacterium]